MARLVGWRVYNIFAVKLIRPIRFAVAMSYARIIEVRGRVASSSFSGPICIVSTYCESNNGDRFPALAVMPAVYFGFVLSTLHRQLHESNLPKDKIAKAETQLCEGAFGTEARSQRRLCIPKYLQRAIGIKPGEKVYIIPGNKYHIISSSPVEQEDIKTTGIERIINGEEKETTTAARWQLVENTAKTRVLKLWNS
jgi:bifunctional DNA-binding transcriptional regulator/antitoxin component of YhaV-PrlF toxin-antitoxin module